MQKIKQLSAHQAQKIAAGEVIERPANIVKELLENAIDAGATRITIHLNDGGKSLIRVQDNGSGMGSADAHICFDRHATSKLEFFDDLPTITTFGFRGEALASIAAISKIKLITKDEVSAHGVAITLHAETHISTDLVACTTGTDISVADLFYQMPARKKFLKTDATESRQITQLVQALCLNHVAIHFTLYIDGHQTLDCPAAHTPADRCVQLWDHGMSKSLLPVTATREKPALAIAGLIGDHHLWKYDRSTIFIFVNNRWIKNQKLGSALLKGYNNVLPHGRFPVACLFITIDPHEVDINVHPRKEEVTFVQPRILEQLIEKTVRTALEQYCTSFKQQPATIASIAPAAVQEQKITTTAMETSPYVFSPNTQTPYFSRPFSPSVATFTAPADHQEISTSRQVEVGQQLTTAHTFDQPTEQPATDHYTLLGQFNKTYILIEQDDQLIMIDQHAAHERVLYELFAQRFDDSATIRLIFPQTVTVSESDMALITNHLDIFTSNGIMLEPFGQDQLIIQSVPVHAKNLPLAQLVHQVISWLKEYATTEKEQFFKLVNEKLHAQMACKAAVKAGDELSTQQMQDLLKKLHQTANRFSCPHGRPTSWPLALAEIERKFKRR